MKINELFKDVIGEGLEYEFKAKLNVDNPLKWAKTLVAYANGSGGTLFIGVSDDGEAFGLTLKEIDQTKNLISTENNRHIFPHIKYKTSLRNIDDELDRFVMAVSVSSSDSIVRYKSGDFNETVYVKGDANSTPATPEEIIALHKRKSGIDNELTNIKYDPKEWSQYIALCKEFRANGSEPTIKELQNEDVVSSDGYVKSGFLMFKDDYNEDDTLVSCRLWTGVNKAGSVVDTLRERGSIAKCFKDALIFIERNSRIGWKKTNNGGRKEIRSYPEKAAREALVNAFAHRDYSILGTQIDVDIYNDRIDITSPGDWLLPRKFEEYNVYEIPSIRRNKIISACFKVANLMERAGTGFETMTSGYEMNLSSFRPSVIARAGFTIVRLPDMQYGRRNIDFPVGDVIYPSEVITTNANVNNGRKIMRECTMNLEQIRVLTMLGDGPMGIKELQSDSLFSSRYHFIEKVIKPLMKDGMIERIGSDKSPKAYYKLK